MKDVFSIPCLRLQRIILSYMDAYILCKSDAINTTAYCRLIYVYLIVPS